VSAAHIQGIRTHAYTVPTEQPESDGTLKWDAVTVVTAEIESGGEIGIGYTYADRAASVVIEGVLAEVVTDRDALDVPGCWWAMVHAIRNLGWPGICATAIAAVDVAMWDLKAKLLGLSLADLLGRAHPAVPVYGSGGLTSYSEAELCRQLAAWVQDGIPRVKMKVGRDPAADISRVRAVRAAIGDDPALYVDANGAYARKEALDMARQFRELGVSWFEEPVSSDDLEGLRLLRDRGPSGMDIAAGEYGYEPTYFRRLVDAGAVDVVQADVTRVSGITGLLAVGSLCVAAQLPFSAHCSPQIHAHACASLGRLRHIEYFHTHARVEQILFDGVLAPEHGCLRPDPARPGLGIELKRADAERFAV
jgi:L-alanine-DL-glutamate epimerase-like enolase superfamily enzyme